MKAIAVTEARAAEPAGTVAMKAAAPHAAGAKHAGMEAAAAEPAAAEGAPVETAAAETATVEAAATTAATAVTAAATIAATRQRGAWLGHCQNRRERGDGNTQTASDADGLHADLLLNSPPEMTAVAEIWRLSPASVLARG
jgi:hypothetical protein